MGGNSKWGDKDVKLNLDVPKKKFFKLFVTVGVYIYIQKIVNTVESA